MLVSGEGVPLLPTCKILRAPYEPLYAESEKILSRSMVSRRLGTSFVSSFSSGCQQFTVGRHISAGGGE